MTVFICFILPLSFSDTSLAEPIVSGYFIVPTESALLFYFAQLVSLKLLQVSMILAVLIHWNSKHDLDNYFG